MPAGEAGRYGQNRQLVDHDRNNLAAQFNGLQTGRGRHDVGDWLSSLGALVFQSEAIAGSHHLERIDDAGPAWVETYAGDGNPGVGVDQTGHHPECRRGDIAGNRHVDGFEGGGNQREGQAVRINLGPHGGHHAFCMVAGQGWLVEHGGASGGKSGEHQARFHLGAGHRHVVFDGTQVSAPNRQRGEGVTVATHDGGAHLLQRLDDATHGSGAQRRIAGEHRQELLARQQSG